MIFGPLWDAPVCDDATVYPETPTNARCLRCREQFVEGDQGFVMPLMGKVDPEFLVGVHGAGSLIAEHRECNLSSIVGHSVGVCRCTGFDPYARETGREVLRRVQAGDLL